MKFKMAATATLTLLFLSNGLLSVAAGYITAKFHSSTSIGGRDIAVCAKIQNGFNVCLIFCNTCMYDLQGNTRAKFRANMCNTKRVMSYRLNSKWRPPPS